MRLDIRQLKFAEKTHESQRTRSLSISNRANAVAGIVFVFICIVFLVRHVWAKTSNDTSFHRELYYEDIKSLQQQLTQGSLTARQFAAKEKMLIGKMAAAKTQPKAVRKVKAA